MHLPLVSAADQHRKCNRQHSRHPSDSGVVPTKLCGELGQYHLPLCAGGIRKIAPALCGLLHTRSGCTHDFEQGGEQCAAHVSRAQVPDPPVRYFCIAKMMIVEATAPVRLVVPQHRERQNLQQQQWVTCVR